MEIRKAVEADFEQMVPLLAELLRRPIEEIEGMKEVFENGLASDKRTVFIADREGKVEGLITLTVYHKEAFYAHCVKAEIDEFIVSGDSRGGGVAGQWMERAVQYAAERGCKFVELWSRLDNERAHAFYEKYGYEKRGIFLQKTM